MTLGMALLPAGAVAHLPHQLPAGGIDVIATGGANGRPAPFTLQNLQKSVDGRRR